jgi:hypothetical protein
MAFAISKTDSVKGHVFGWANHVVDPAGNLIEDSQGDVITPGELEDAVVDFMLDYRKSGEMHSGLAVGHVFESLVFSPEKASAMGLAEDVAKSVPTGWWIGVKVGPEVMAKVKDGTYQMFSIQGEAVREAV